MLENDIKIMKNSEDSKLTPFAEQENRNLQNVSMKWGEFIKELKIQWRTMWRERIDDKVRAEGIAREDYSLLFWEKGTIVVATRKCKTPDFFEILEFHRKLFGIEESVGYVNPVVGGWRKFVRSTLSKQQCFTKRKRPDPPNPKGKETLQKKKGGRGWIHQF